MTPWELTATQIAPAFPGVKLMNIELFWPFVREALRENQLGSPLIVAATLGTIAAETAGFVPITELRSKYNTRVRFGDKYDGIKNLGNTQPGDGGLFCGRGFVQLTGRRNYTRYGERIGVDLVEHPELANEPRFAAQLLALYIADHAETIESALKAQDYAKARHAVNGGNHGLERFTNAYKAILGALR